jgi:hypothetical protein
MNIQSAYEAIDLAIAKGVTSVEMLEAVMNIQPKAPRSADKGRLVSYILEQHMDEELEMHLQDSMGYDPMFHRMQVAADGTMSF